MTPEPAEKVNLGMEGLDFVDHPTPHRTIADPLLAASLVPGSPLFERFRVLRAKVKTIGAERPFRCVGIMGATEGEGTSTVALGLGVSLAEERRRVLLIEATLREPALTKVLGLAPNGGLANWLRSDGLRPVTVRRLEPWGLRVLPAGTAVVSPVDLLGSERMAKLIEVARRSFEYVIVDCPPVIPNADALVLQELVDGALLVVRARHTYRETIVAAHGHLRAGVVQGIVFNDEREILTRRFGRFRGR